MNYNLWLTHEVVKTEPELAAGEAQVPGLVRRIVGHQWDGDDPDGEVGDGQRKQEVVADRLQLLVQANGEL